MRSTTAGCLKADYILNWTTAISVLSCMGKIQSTAGSEKLYIYMPVKLNKGSRGEAPLIYKAVFTVTGLGLDGDMLAESGKPVGTPGERFREIRRLIPMSVSVWCGRSPQMVELLAVGRRAFCDAARDVSHDFRKQLYAFFSPRRACHRIAGDGQADIRCGTATDWISGERGTILRSMMTVMIGGADSIVFIWVPVGRGESKVLLRNRFIVL